MSALASMIVALALAQTGSGFANGAVPPDARAADGDAPAAPHGEAPEAAPSNGPGTARDVDAAAMVIIEVNETGLQVQERWTLRPKPGKTIPAAALTVQSPPGARMVRTDDASPAFKADEASRAVLASGPLSAPAELTYTYVLDKPGASFTLDRAMPFTMEQGRVIIQELPGLTLSTSVPSERREHDMGGVRYAIYEIGPMAAGTTLKIQMDGFPSHTRWPRRIAVGVAALVVAWMIAALLSKKEIVRDTTFGPLSARARRDRIVKAIEVLDRDLAAEKITAKKFERRQKELMRDLAEVLEEIARTSGASAAPDGRSAEG